MTYLYGVVQHMQNTYDNGARVTNVALHPKLMKLQKRDNAMAFLALKNPQSQPNLDGDLHNKLGSREP